jgi:spore coat protein U-like protein
MNRTLTVLAISAAAALVLAVVPARAAISNGTVTVKATVAATCILNSPTLSFGAYDPTSATALDQSTTLTVNCTKGTAWVIGLDRGANGAGTRNMKDTGASGDLLNYELYTDALRTNVWTNGTVASPTVASGSGSGAALGQPVIIYGRVLVNQYVSANTGANVYQDSVKATVNF